MGNLVEKLEEKGKVVVRGKYISNAWNMEHLDTREEFLKVVDKCDIICHNDLSDRRVSKKQMETLLIKHDYLDSSDFRKDEKSDMYYLDMEEFICSKDNLTYRFVESGE